MVNTPTKDRFLEDVAQHEMTVELITCVHRCLLFKRPGTSNKHFRITTWPGHLAISGDMGAYTFSRLPDMFDFFRGDEINPGYWRQKLTSQDIYCEAYRYSPDEFEERVKEWIDNYWEADDKEKLKEMAWDEIKNYSGDEHVAFNYVLTRFDPDGLDLEGLEGEVNEDTLNFEDFWEVNCKIFNYRFIWCLHAIQWAVEQHDKQFKGE